MNTHSPTTAIRFRLAALAVAFGLGGAMGLAAASAASAASGTVPVDARAQGVHVNGTYTLDCESSPHILSIHLFVENVDEGDASYQVTTTSGLYVALSPPGIHGALQPNGEYDYSYAWTKDLQYSFTGNRFDELIAIEDDPLIPIWSHTFTCGDTPPPPAKVCVIAAQPGVVSFAWGGVTRTYHFASKVKLPKSCVTESQVRAWAKELGFKL